MQPRQNTSSGFLSAQSAGFGTGGLNSTSPNQIAKTEKTAALIANGKALNVIAPLISVMATIMKCRKLPV